MLSCSRPLGALPPQPYHLGTLLFLLSHLCPSPYTIATCPYSMMLLQLSHIPLCSPQRTPPPASPHVSTQLLFIFRILKREKSSIKKNKSVYMTFLCSVDLSIDFYDTTKKLKTTHLRSIIQNIYCICVTFFR